MFCPKCKSEFLAGYAECANCKVPLVEKLGQESFSDDAMLKYFEGKTVELVTSGPMAMVREAQRLFEAQGVQTRVVAEEEKPELGGTHQVFRLEIVREDLERARKVVGDRWKEFVEAEGLTPGEAKDVVLAAGAETECPACTTRFTPANPDTAECPDCGLFLGVPA